MDPVSQGVLGATLPQSATSGKNAPVAGLLGFIAGMSADLDVLMHQRAQQLGRSQFFADYRLRIAAVVRDYGLDDRDEAPQ